MRDLPDDGDDDDDMRELMCMLLRGRYEVSSANDGVQGLEVIRAVRPDLLVLDEATSAVDPATEVRVQRALDSLTRGRTSIAIAHRLSTAEAADEVIVVDKGRLVERGTHLELVGAGGVYSGMHASWMAQHDV